ncbi:ATP-binding protein [Paenibacillus sp. HB172176]|uniref:ATP-binding protein n=1 Tax=Paenibacillus sp. HB172176 TaxID=2493690 RepID=UPI00143C5374|nr:ATP-binding protein [Paenibacillus sp. HB172176]
MSNEKRVEIDRLIKLDNRLDALQQLNEQLEEIGASAGWSERSILDLSLACEEIVVNIINYGFPGGGEHEIEIGVQASPESVRISIRDDGVPFNPLQEADPLSQLDMDVDERPIGGLGIFFVKRLMDAVSYEYDDGKNCILMSKNQIG